MMRSGGVPAAVGVVIHTARDPHVAAVRHDAGGSETPPLKKPPTPPIPTGATAAWPR
jgi:hypothetical protein